jgi:hypothetical protein
VVELQVNGGVLRHLIDDGVDKNDSSCRQPLLLPSSLTTIVAFGLRCGRNVS